MTQGILTGLSVVELAHPLTEYAGCVLAGLGAEVFLIEPPAGAITRQRHPRVPGADPASTRSSLDFLTRNTNKKSVLIDPELATSRQLLGNLCERADVVLDAAPSMFHDIAAGARSATRVTLLDDQQLGGAPIVGFAASGGLASSGWPHQPPCNAPGWLALDGASIYAACVALIGTVARRHGATYLHYEIPYAEAAVAAITPWTRPLHAYGRDALGQGTVTARLGPGGFPIYPTTDGYVRVVLGTPRHWDAFVTLLNNPVELVEGPWQQAEFRAENFDALQLLCAEFTRHYSTAHLFHAGQRLGLTISPVARLRDFRNDPHVQARKLFTTVEDPEFGRMELMRAPVLFDPDDLQGELLPAPAPGAHQLDAEAFVQRVPPQPPGMQKVDPRRPLDGLRVLDLGVGAVVPEACSVLAAFGAQVIKVESRVYPDFLRRSGMNGPDDVDASPTFNQLNLGVKSVAVDMQQAAGRALIKSLLPSCDIVMENMRGGVVAKWGLDYSGARAIKPDIIYLSSQGLGRGPYDGYQTFGPNLQTFSGVTGQWAHPDDPFPVGTTLNHPDHMAGKQALVPVLAALLKRDHSGRGTYIEAAQMETAAYLIGARFLQQSLQREDLRPRGNLQPNMVPHGVYPCREADRWIALAAETEAQWHALCQLLGQMPASLAAVAADRSLASRRQQVPNIDAWIAAWSKTMSIDQAEAQLRRIGVSCSRVLTGDELAQHAEFHGSAFFVELDHPRMGPKVYTGIPVIAAGYGRVGVERPPCLGEHTREIFGALAGVDLETLTRRRIIGY